MKGIHSKTLAAFIAVISLLALGAATAVALLDEPFPGAPWLGSAGQAINETAKEGDIEISVSRISNDASGLAIAIEIAGRPDLGNGVFPVSPPRLENGKGENLVLRSGGPDPNDWRKQTLLFPVATGDFGRAVTLVIDGLEFYDRVQQQTGKDVPHVEIDAKWEIPLVLPTSRAVTRLELAEAIDLGAARLVVEATTFGESGVVVLGRLEGVEPENVPALNIRASLKEPGKPAQTAVLARWGFGSQRERCEFRFATTTSDSATFEVLLRTDDAPGVNMNAVSNLDGRSGAIELRLR